jgi:hypothetical protein
MHPQPRVRNKTKHTSIVTTVTPESPGIPRAVVLTVSFVLSPAIGLFVTVACGVTSANLTPASGRQNHTTSPSANSALVWRHPRPPHPAPNVRDDRETPLRGDGTESQYSCFYLAVKQNFGKSEIVRNARFASVDRLV